MPAHAGHDIIVVGASAGGLEALRQIVARLPSDLAAAVFIVLHIPPDAPSALASILSRAGVVPAGAARHGEAIEHGRIYIAPPNHHLVVHAGHVALEAGPRENGARPSVDVLFRSAARTYRQRVVGIVLSGTLHDGALGLAAIKMRGGITIVQDPDEALFSGMPESALNATEIDYRMRVANIPKRLVELTQHSLEHGTIVESEHQPVEPTTHASDEPNGYLSPKLANHASGLTCPECHGSLWEVLDGDSTRYECRVGHTYSPDALLSDQGEAVEAALWSAVNAMQERAATFHRLGTTNNPLQAKFQERAELTERHASALLQLLRRLINDGEVG